MKKLESLGKGLNKEQQKKIMGGIIPGGGCTQTYTGCNYNADNELRCDYHIVCDNGYVDDLCELHCQNPGDGSGCA